MEVVRNVEISRRRFRKGFECNKGAPGRTRKFAIVSHFHDISSSMYHIFFFFLLFFSSNLANATKASSVTGLRGWRAQSFSIFAIVPRDECYVFSIRITSFRCMKQQKCPKPVKRNVRGGRRNRSFEQKRAFEYRSLLTMLHSFKMIVVVWSRNSQTHCNLVFRCLCYCMKTTWKKYDFIPLNFLLFVFCCLKWNILMLHYKTFEEE